MIKIKQFLCGLTHHRFQSGKSKCEYNKQTDEYTITDTCVRCGKQFSFTAPAKNFGL